MWTFCQLKLTTATRREFSGRWSFFLTLHEWFFCCRRCWKMKFFAHNFSERVSSRPRAEMNLKLWKFAMEKFNHSFYIFARMTAEFSLVGRFSRWRPTWHLCKRRMREIARTNEFFKFSENFKKTISLKLAMHQSTRSIEGLLDVNENSKFPEVYKVSSLHSFCESGLWKFLFYPSSNEWTFPNESHTAVFIVEQSKLFTTEVHPHIKNKASHSSRKIRAWHSCS